LIKLSHFLQGCHFRGTRCIYIYISGMTPFRNHTNNVKWHRFGSQVLYWLYQGLRIAILMLIRKKLTVLISALSCHPRKCEIINRNRIYIFSGANCLAPKRNRYKTKNERHLKYKEPSSYNHFVLPEWVLIKHYSHQLRTAHSCCGPYVAVRPP
jgi:hypothetical protein